MQTNKEALLALLKGEKADFIPEVYSTMKRLGFRKGKSLVIYGAGPVGLVFITLAKYMGLSPIISVDHTEKKLESARTCGADYTLNFDQCNVMEEVLKILPDKADMILDLELNKGQMLLDVRSAVFGACPVEFFGRTAGGLLTPDMIYSKITELYKKLENKTEAGVR